MHSTSENTLVIGIGHPERQDDGVGLVIARKLKNLAPDNLSAIEATGEFANLIDLFSRSSRIIVVDAICSGSEAGRIHSIDAIEKTIPTDWFGQYSTHEFGLAEAVELARNLDQLPEKLMIIGIEGKDFEMGTTLSEEVEEAIEPTIQLVLSEAKALRKESKTNP